MKHKKHTRSQIAGRWLLGWTLFIGIGAVAGASGMLLDPSGKAMGMDAMLPYFQVLPLAAYLYQDYIFPGIALLIVNGLTNLTAAVLLVLKKKIGVVLGGVFGVTLMLLIHVWGRQGRQVGQRNGAGDAAGNRQTPRPGTSDDQRFPGTFFLSLWR